MISMLRRNTPTSRGQRASPRVESSDKTMAIIAPISVEAPAMFSVSISEGRNFTISPGRFTNFSPASVSTSAGKSKI